MKKVLLLICTILCANVLLAQTEFMVGELLYQVTNPNEVEVKDCVPVATSIIIPTTVSNSGTTYTVTSIGDSAFYNCSSLTSVTIPNSVTSIGNYAFYGCSSLTSVTIPNSVTSIGTGAFCGCSSLTSVTIPNNVISIDFFVFYNCSSLTSIDIHNSVTSIGGWAFYGCSSLTSVNIPNSATSIGDYAFSSCSSLTSVTIGNSVTSIGVNAFSDCSSLTTLNFNAINCNDFIYANYYHPFIDSPISTITIGDNVQRIPYSFAYSCSSLTSVTISNSVTSIGNSAFKDCSSLTSITIPNSVTSIGDSTFSDCSSLTSVTIGNSVTSISYNAFSDCSSLTTLNFNAINCNDFIYENYYPYRRPPFYYCPITTINIGNSVERIPYYFAYNLDSLTSVTIGNSVTSIGYRAFESCSSLDTVTCLATTPPTIGGDSFSSTPSNKKLIVYCGLKNYYATVWNSDFAYDNIYEIPFAIDVNVNNEVGGNVTIENNCSTATLTATANDCYQFVSWNDGNTDNPRIISFTSDTSLTAIFEDLNTELSATICEGSVYNENNFNVSEAGVYTQNLTSVNGCDSIVTLTLNVNSIYNTELAATICPGERFIGNGFNVTAGVYTQSLNTINGCDSIITLTVTEYPTFDTTINATINAGETYAEFGFNESESGTYVQNLQTENGCDSTITLNLTVNSSLYDVAELAEITFYPNPTRGKVTFNQAIEKIEVIDLSGKTLQTYENANEINIETLPAGVYHLRMTIGDKTTTRKVIKE